MSEKKILLTKSNGGGEFKTLEFYEIPTSLTGIDTGIIVDDKNYEFEIKTANPVDLVYMAAKQGDLIVPFCNLNFSEPTAITQASCGNLFWSWVDLNDESKYGSNSISIYNTNISSWFINGIPEMIQVEDSVTHINWVKINQLQQIYYNEQGTVIATLDAAKMKDLVPVDDYSNTYSIHLMVFSMSSSHSQSFWLGVPIKFYFFRVKHNGELISEIVPQENETTFRLYDTVRKITIYEKEK